MKFWSGETLRVLEGATLIRLGGHFAGGQVLHWAEGVGGKGALLSGDIIQVSFEFQIPFADALILGRMGWDD